MKIFNKILSIILMMGLMFLFSCEKEQQNELESLTANVEKNEQPASRRTVTILQNGESCQKETPIFFESDDPSIVNLNKIEVIRGDILDYAEVDDEVSSSGFSFAPKSCDENIVQSDGEYFLVINSDDLCPAYEAIINISICGVPFSVTQLPYHQLPFEIPISVPCDCDFTVELFLTEVNNIKCKKVGTASATLYNI